MSERQSLLAAIAETPHDDAVRLVFAAPHFAGLREWSIRAAPLQPE